MNDSNYINNYVNVTLETAHSFLNDLLQLKTQFKMVNDQVSQKDLVIQELNQHIESLTTENEGRRSNEGEMQTEMQQLRDNASSWEAQYNSLVTKVSHMDTLTNQYNELKGQFIQKENEFNNVNNELNSKQSECEELKRNIEDLKRQNEEHIAAMQKQYKEEVNLVKRESDTNKSKLEKLSKKEDKTTVLTPVETPSKKVINKESSVKTEPLVKKVENILQENDDF